MQHQPKSLMFHEFPGKKLFLEGGKIKKRASQELIDQTKELEEAPRDDEGSKEEGEAEKTKIHVESPMPEYMEKEDTKEYKYGGKSAGATDYLSKTEKESERKALEEYSREYGTGTEYTGIAEYSEGKAAEYGGKSGYSNYSPKYRGLGEYIGGKGRYQSKTYDYKTFPTPPPPAPPEKSHISIG